MIGAILSILAAILPTILGLFSPEAKRRRENEAYDKALTCGDVANISDLLSQRFDRVRSQGGSGNSGQPGTKDFTIILTLPNYDATVTH